MAMRVDYQAAMCRLFMILAIVLLRIGVVWSRSCTADRERHRRLAPKEDLVVLPEEKPMPYARLYQRMGRVDEEGRPATLYTPWRWSWATWFDLMSWNLFVWLILFERWLQGIEMLSSGLW